VFAENFRHVLNVVLSLRNFGVEHELETRLVIRHWLSEHAKLVGLVKLLRYAILGLLGRLLGYHLRWTDFSSAACFTLVSYKLFFGFRVLGSVIYAILLDLGALNGFSFSLATWSRSLLLHRRKRNV